MMSSNRKIFNICKDVYERKISKEEGIKNLVENSNFNIGSARMVVLQIFPQFLDGNGFTRTLSVDLFNSFLKFIVEDYGSEKLRIVLSGLEKHIEYSRRNGDAKIKLGQVYDSYKEYLEQNNNSFQNEIEQNEISNYYARTKTREEIALELMKMQDVDDEKVFVNHKSYKRNNKAIALIKILRKFECQICGYSITKKDGSKYVEAAHIKPKHLRGKENANNIILLCPNHHKEFDFGILEITEHDLEKISFNLNGKIYNLDLSFN
jgi:5-methylcytosine-specific restriction protein A